jgi:hypothetical protein
MLSDIYAFCNLHNYTIGSIIFAFVGVLCYTNYSKKFEKISRETSSTLFSALWVYFIATLQLLVLTAISSLIWKDAWVNFKLPQNTQMWAYGFWKENNITTDIALSLVIVIGGYALSIATETKSRTKINFGSFDIVYQINAVVIVFLSLLFFDKTLHIRGLVGVLTVIIASLMPLSMRIIEKKLYSKRILLWALLSGLSCGIAIFTDSSLLTKQIIFYPEFSLERTPVFIAYEALTFGGPFLLLALIFLFRFEFKQLIDNIKSEWQRAASDYFKAAFWTSGFYVTGVYALYLGAANNSFLASCILAGIPLVNVWADKNPRSGLQKIIEYSASVLVFIGLILVALYT